MKKIVLFNLVFFLFILESNAQLAVWNFNDGTLSASSTDANVSASDATHNGLGGTTQFFSCNEDAWSPSSWGSGDYAEYSITADAGVAISVTGFTYVARRSGSGPSEITVRSSNDGFTLDLLSNTISTSCSSKGGSFTPITVAAGSTITFRLYGVGSSSGGNLRMDDVTILGSVLPVEMTSFSVIASGRKVQLEWETASEINNSHFSVEVSRDGKNFDSIGKVIGNGTTSDTHSYSYIHSNPFSGVSYYRLNQMDFNGANEYSKIRTVSINNASGLSVFPSTAVSEVKVIADIPNDADIRIIDMMGRTVLTAMIEKDTRLKRIDISSLSQGHYILHVQAGTQIMNQHFVKISK